LLKFLAQFLQCLRQQMTLLEELLVVLAREEELVVSFSLPDFEKLVVEKDQIVRLIQAAESRRLQILQKLCFMMAFDARGKSPSLSEFVSVAQSYQKNVASLIDPETFGKLSVFVAEIEHVAQVYRSQFLHAQPRIEQNKLILKSLALNFKRSLMVMESESASSNRYNEKGRRVERTMAESGSNFVRVRA
jgi:flagellar biosynthesis/type III secretory pathway chaperone